MNFEWDAAKNAANRHKHGVTFHEAQQAFWDPQRVIAADTRHSTKREQRFFCFGKVGGMVMTVRFTYRNKHIRIFGAGYWREGRQRYEKENKL